MCGAAKTMCKAKMNDAEAETDIDKPVLLIINQYVIGLWPL
jgi:hypothetical protein